MALLNRLPTRRRQARGERRIEQILHAATRVFAKVGYARATTNAIAAEAGVSPGTLYQFFTNKEQIAEALEARYADLLVTTRGAAFRPGSGTLEDKIGSLVDSVVTLAVATPGFQALFSERPYSASVAQAAHAHHAELVGRLEQIIDEKSPSLPKSERSLKAQMATQFCRAVMPSIVAADADGRDRLVAELKTALVSYLSAQAAQEPSRRSRRRAG